MPRLFSFKVILYFSFLLLMDWIFLAPFRSVFFHPVLLYFPVAYAAFEWDWKLTLRFAAAIGVLRDFLSTQPLGVETFSLFAAALGLIFFVQKMERRSVIMRFAGTFFYLFFTSLLVLVFSNLLGFVQLPVFQCLADAFTTAYSSLLFLPVIFFMTKRWFGERLPRRQFELFR